MELFKAPDKLENGWLHYEPDSELLPYSLGFLRPDDGIDPVAHKHTVLFLHGYRDSEAYKDDKMAVITKLCLNHHVAFAHPNCGPSWWDKFRVEVPANADPALGFREFSAVSPISYLENSLLPHLEESQPEGEAWRNPILLGISMGGHGTLKLALNNPKKFPVIATMSAAARLNITELEHKNVAMTIKNVFGEKAHEESIVTIIEHIREAPETVLMSCGTKDALFYQANVLVANRLAAISKKFTWIPIDSMGHDWEAFNKGASEIFDILFNKQ